jgi:hypothetical protein
MTAVSRVPVEIWHKIIEMVIFTTDLLNPDPYDVPPSKLFERAVYMRSQDTFPMKRKDERAPAFISQLVKLRLVCTGWNSFVRPFRECIATLSFDARDDEELDIIIRPEGMSTRIKILRTPFHPGCPCRFGEYCQECAWPRHPGGGRMRIDNPLTIRAAESLDYVNDSTLVSLLDSEASFPHLRGISVFWGSEGWWGIQYLKSSRFKEISTRMPNLVHLELFVRGNEGVVLPLDFPHLKSLDLRCRRPRGLMDQKWNLPSLTAFLLSTSGLDIDDTIGYLKNNAPNLTFLSLLVSDTFDTDQKSDIWASFPQLIALRGSVDFLLANIPPPTHPLRHFMTGEPSDPAFYRPASDPDLQLASKLLMAVRGWPNCQSVFLEDIKWKRIIDSISSVTQWSVQSHAGATNIMEYEHLRVGLKLEELGVRYEDTYGLSFTEACDRFGGTNTRTSVKAYVEAFRKL